ncbi:MAG: hypothetical protein AAF967_09095 [Pseudomonadota bacterium]
MLLRLAVTLRDRFHLELQAHRPLFASLRSGLRNTSFVALWDRTLVLQGHDEWLLIDTATDPVQQDSILILLNPHLLTLSDGFAMQKPAAIAGQLELFPVRANAELTGKPALRASQADAERQRRSA